MRHVLKIKIALWCFVSARFLLSSPLKTVHCASYMLWQFWKKLPSIHGNEDPSCLKWPMRLSHAFPVCLTSIPFVSHPSRFVSRPSRLSHVRPVLSTLVWNVIGVSAGNIMTAWHIDDNYVSWGMPESDWLTATSGPSVCKQIRCVFNSSTTYAYTNSSRRAWHTYMIVFLSGVMLWTW